MSKKAGTALSVMAMVFMGALASPLTVLAADAEETYQPALYATIWALLPPLVAIVLAPVSYTHLIMLRLILRKYFCSRHTTMRLLQRQINKRFLCIFLPVFRIITI